MGKSTKVELKCFKKKITYQRLRKTATTCSATLVAAPGSELVVLITAETSPVSPARVSCMRNEALSLLSNDELSISAP